MDELGQAKVDIGRLETEVKHLRADLTELKGMVLSLTVAATHMQTQFAEAKGGWKMLLLISGAAGALGSVVTWLVTHTRPTP